MSSGVIRGESWFTLSRKCDQHFLRVVERESCRCRENRLHQLLAAQQDRRDRGVGLHSEGAVVTATGACGDELAKPRAQRRLPAQDLLREPREVLRRVRLEREEVPDLGILAAGSLRRLDERRVGRVRVGSYSTPGRNIGSMDILMRVYRNGRSDAILRRD